MIKFVWFFLFTSIFTSNIYAEFQVINVNNDAISDHGLTPDSIQDWLTKKNIEQDENGEEYYDFLDGRLYLPANDQGNQILNPDCIKIEKLGDSQRNSLIVLIKTNQQCLGQVPNPQWKLSYVFKNLEESDHELKQLERAQSSDEFQVLQTNSNDYPKPILAAEMAFNYLNEDGEDHYFILLEAAQGHPYKEIVKTETIQNVTKAYSELGRRFGNMHIHYMIPETSFNLPGISFESNPIKSGQKRITDYYKTLTHGDAHGSNVYFDFEREQVEMIDNETFALSIQDRKSIEDDLDSIFYGFFSAFEEDPVCTSGLQNYCNNLIIASQSFFNAYISTYPANERPALIAYIKLFIDHFLKSSANKQHEKDNARFILPYLYSMFDRLIAPPITIPTITAPKKSDQHLKMQPIPMKKETKKKMKSSSSTNKMENDLARRIEEAFLNE
jgi:hypothetical protein